MRWFCVFAVAFVAATVQAEEPRLPKKCLCSPPQLGIAKATGSGDALVIELKLVDVKWVGEAKDVTVEKIVVVDGKEQKVTETQKVTMGVAMPGWTSRILKPQNIRFEFTTFRESRSRGMSLPGRWPRKRRCWFPSSRSIRSTCKPPSQEHW